MPEFMIEDGRVMYLEEDHDRETVLEYLGSSYTYRDLMTWKEHDAYVIRYEGGKRQIVGAVDDILAKKIRPPIEPLTIKEMAERDW